MSEILSKCLHRYRGVVYKTDVLRRIFVRSFVRLTYGIGKYLSSG